MILIIGKKEDVHIQSVIKHLKPKNYIIISFSDIPEKLSFQYLIEDNKINASFKDYNGNTIINFNEIKSIWVRRLNKLSIPQLKGSPRQYAMDEFNLLLNSIHKLFPNIKVLSGAEEQTLAANKAWQKRLAIDLGLKVPKSFIGNNLKESGQLFSAEDLVYTKAFNKKLIPIDKNWMQKLLEKIYNKISDETDSYEILNSINSGMAITSYKDLRSKSSDISPYPMIIEEAVNKLFELRVTVIKDKVVACKIDSQWSSGRGKSDWREDIDNIPHSLFELPVDVKSKCIQLMEAMSIGYGAFDFIVTPKNEYYFLEVNPSGQWLWIDQKTKSTISKFIANCLSNS